MIHPADQYDLEILLSWRDTRPSVRISIYARSLGRRYICRDPRSIEQIRDFLGRTTLSAKQTLSRARDLYLHNYSVLKSVCEADRLMREWEKI